MTKSKANSEASKENAHGRSSMRRLSSIASLHQLLSFSRNRRSTTNEGSVSSVASSIPTSSTPSAIDAKPDRALEEISQNIRPRPPHAHGGFLRKSNYAPLPEPSSGIPRSKTFSNLPIPVKSQKRHNYPTQEPLTEESLTEDTILSPSATRLPTPPDSTRRYMPFNTGNASRFGFANKLPRSDTEPLLVGKSKQKVNLKQMLKENEEVEVTKRSTPADLFGSSFNSESSSKQEEYTTIPRHPSFSGALPKSSPVLKSTTRARVNPAQRWNSQPNILNAQLREVTPPSTALPDFSDQLTRSLIREASYTKAQREKQAIEQARSHSRAVWEAQPAAYWAGRVSSLLDAAKGDETTHFFAGHGDEFPAKRETDAAYQRSGAVPRLRNALESLYTSCMTPEARASFVVFQMQFAALQDEPELARPFGRTPLSLSSRHDLTSNASTPPNSKRSVSFVNRLLGRNKRSSTGS